MKKKTTRKKMNENVDQHVGVSLLMSNLGQALDELRLDDEQRVKLGSVLKPLMMHVGASTYAGGPGVGICYLKRRRPTMPCGQQLSTGRGWPSTSMDRRRTSGLKLSGPACWQKANGE